MKNKERKIQVNKQIINIYHAPTGRSYTCLCFYTNVFAEDCRQYVIESFQAYSVNPQLRLCSKIDKVVDDMIREKISVPYAFRMRLESRHCTERKTMHFKFRFLDETCMQCNVFLKGLSDDDKQILSEYDDIDFVVIYEGILGARQETGADDKGGFCGPKPQVPFLADGACPVCS